MTRQHFTLVTSFRVGAAACVISCLLFLVSGAQATAQQVVTPPQAPLPAISMHASQTSAAVPAGSQALTLEEAIDNAQQNEPSFASAVAASKVASLDKSIARAALLPNVVYHNQYLYTEAARGATGSANASAGATTTAGVPRFIANNSVHEYMSQGVATETIGVQQINALSRASALQAVAAAELEIARRGLVSTVVGLYYNAIAAERKVAVARRAADEANDFTGNTRKREDAREVAHSDVIKAQLQQQQRERDLVNTRLESEKARLELAVLIFPDPHAAFTFPDADAMPSLGTREEIEAIAGRNNAELKSAISSLRAASLDVTGARAAYLPDLALNFTYGIDSTDFAVHAPDGTRNLGYSASATLDIPVWDWFATHDRIKQKLALRDSARVALTATQRRLVAQLDEYYNEAAVARDQMQSLKISVETARESLRLARLRYTAGETNVLEVVDAHNSLAAEENAQQDGIVRYQSAVANLQLLTGQSLTETK
jgi:outer membrane protein TolC